MPLEPQEIIDHRQKAKEKSNEQAIKHIAGLDTKDSIPVIMQILQDLLTYMKKQPLVNADVKDNIYFLEFAYHILQESDITQNLKKFKLLFALRKINKVKMLEELGSLKEN